MAPLPPGDRTDLTRIARIIAAVSIAGPVIAELLHPWIVRFPAIGAAVAIAEYLWTAYARARSTPPIAPIPMQGGPPDDPFWP